MIRDTLNTKKENFGEAALALFRRQAKECAPYAQYLKLIGVEAEDVADVAQIPFLPIEIFKTHKVYCGAREPEIVFTSSGTGGAGSSKHHVARAADYEQTFRRAFEHFYGQAAIFALLPGYRPESSLIYMVRGLGGRFYPDDHQGLLRDMAAHKGPKILFGVSHALLDMAERHPVRLENTIVMETGGMKGRREELSKEELHRRLREAFGVGEVHSEYGMAELSSQAYSAGGGVFVPPPWMRVTARDLNDPFAPHTRGGLNIIDLANIHSCAFIQTQDVGTVFADGSFTVAGRADRSEIRGCNLLLD
jgi:hypothetical protein